MLHDDDRGDLFCASARFERSFRQYREGGLQIGSIGHPDFGPDPFAAVAEGKIFHRRLRQRCIGNNQLLVVTVAGNGGADVHFFNAHHRAVDLKNISRGDGAFEEQNDAGDKVLRNVLHRKPDAHGEDGTSGEEGVDVNSHRPQCDDEAHDEN